MELRRKVTGKKTYDGVFSGHRQKFTGGAPVVKVEEYREIFGGSGSSGGGSSIPVLDLSSLNNVNEDGEFGLEIGKSDYVSIFGGFRDNDIAAGYEEFVARDKARVPSSTSHSSFDDLAHQSSDELKQFNMSYNQISQRSKDGLDGTTHVTQLHVVPGFTCFIDESTSQPKKETKKQKSSVTNNIHPSVNSSKADYPNKQMSRNAVELISKHHQDEFKIVQDDLKSQPSKVSSPPAAPATKNVAASQPKMETKKQTSVSDDISLKMFQADIRSQPSKVSSSRVASAKNDEAAAQLKKEIMKQNSLSDNINLKTSQANIRSQPSEVSSLRAASAKSDEAASQLKKEIVKQNSISDINLKTFQVDIKSKPSKVSSSHAASTTNDEAVSPIKKETEKQNFLSDDINLKTSQADIRSQPSKVSSSTAASTINDEVASQPKKETEKQKSLSDVTNLKTFQADIRSQPSKVSSSHAASATNDEASSQLKKETEKQKSLSDDRNFMAFQADLKPQPSKVSSPPAASATHAEPPSQPKKETKKQKSLSDDLSSNTYQADIKSHPSKVSVSRATSATNLDNHKDYQKRSTATNTGTSESDALKEIPPTCFDEELDVNSASATSSAALRKAIEKAQESIRIAKESVGRKKEGLKFSSKSFKDSLKVKARVATVSKCEEQKEKDDIMKVRVYKHGSKSIFSDFRDGEKLFGAKRVINEIHEKISESTINPEIPVRSRLELRDDKIVCNAKEGVGETEVIRPGSSGNPESTENNTHEAPQKDYHRPNGFLVLESCERKPGDMEDNINIEKVEAGPSSTHILVEELNNLTVYQNVEDEEKISEGSDQNDHQNLGLLENEKQEDLEQECDEKVACEKVVEDVMELKENGDTESHKEEDKSEKFYDVYEVEMIVNAQNKEGYEMKETENDSLEETWKKIHGLEMYENSSSDYDDAEESENASDTQESCKVEQNNNNAESSEEIDDVTCSSEFKVEDTEEKQRLENISADQTASEDNEDECEPMSDNFSNCGLAELDLQQNAPEQNNVRSESSADTVHGMEIEVKEYKEREETVEEETVVSAKEEERPEVKTKMETGTSEEPKVEKEQTKRIKEVTAEERERERNRLAVERAIREVRERAFADARERVERAAVERANAEVRQRVMADAQEKIAKASDKTSAQSKLRAERAAVERATAEARQRALEKAISQKKMSEPRVQVTEIKQTSSSDIDISNGTSTESALRSKAKQEKDNKIMERAAKALAEKEKRDSLVLREQAERNRLSDNLNAEIKRWSTGKEGNLRALLSTLQYILGAESGWQPVSLTEIITTSAVKKAYRKATLCVHPDKVQQRGASIQQKYICEKVFDLLKAAWNRFNSEER